MRYENILSESGNYYSQKQCKCPGIPYELRDKNTTGWRRVNIATQERKVCDMEVKIVTFVVKGSAQLTVPPDRQK